MLKIKTTKQFEKDYKKALKSGRDIQILKQVINWIVNKQALPPEFKDHKLIDNYHGRRECHLTADWLLIYKLDKDIVVLERTGFHLELFK